MLTIKLYTEQIYNSFKEQQAKIKRRLRFKYSRGVLFMTTSLERIERLNLPFTIAEVERLREFTILAEKLTANEIINNLFIDLSKTLEEMEKICEVSSELLFKDFYTIITSSIPLNSESSHEELTLEDLELFVKDNRDVTLYENVIRAKLCNYYTNKLLVLRNKK